VGPPFRLLTGVAAIVTAGTAVVLSATSRIAARVTLQVDTAKSFYMMAGDSSVKATSGSQQGVSFMKTLNNTVTPSRPLIIEGPIDLATIYVDGPTDGDIAIWEALVAD